MKVDTMVNGGRMADIGDVVAHLMSKPASLRQDLLKSDTMDEGAAEDAVPNGMKDSVLSTTTTTHRDGSTSACVPACLGHCVRVCTCICACATM